MAQPKFVRVDDAGKITTPGVVQQMTDIAKANGVPAGGTVGQVLQRSSTGAATWGNAPSGLPSGGSAGQVVTRQADGSAAWAQAPKGDAGRGIKSIVSSTADPTKATVTYTDNATEVITLPTGAAGKSIKSFGIPDPTTGVSTVTFSDNSTTTITLPKGPKGDAAVWSKDEQAKAQGYWIVVSPTAPANATYTTADGTTVPVIWQKPVEQVVPVSPEEPFWGKGDTTITVAKLVGVDYKITAFIKDGVSTPANVVIPEAQAYKVTTAPGAPTLPFSVKVEAVAEPGYRLLGPYSWTVQYLDPNGLSLLTSDGFSGADGTTIINRPTDVYAGGTAKTWLRLNGATTASPVYAIKSNTLAVEPSQGGTSYNEAFLNLGADKQHVAFDLSWNTADTKQLGFIVGLRNTTANTLAGTYFSFSSTQLSYRAPGQNDAQVAYSAPTGGKMPNGRYVLEAFGSTVAVTVPGGTRQIFSVPAADSSAAGGYMYFRVNGNTGAAFTLDNLVISSVGV